MIFTIKNIKNTFLIFSIFPLYAQMIGSPLKLAHQPQLIWGDKNLAVIEQFGTHLKLCQILNKKVERVQIPENTLGISYGTSGIQVVRLVDQSFFLYSKSHDNSWIKSPITTGQTEKRCGFPFSLYETGKSDLFFAINVETGFVMDGEASCCAWYRRHPNGTLEMESIIPIKSGEPLFWPVRNSGKFLYAQFSPNLGGITPLLDYPIRVPGAFVIVSWKAGILWIIKDGDTSPTRIINLLNLDGDFVKGKFPFPPVILGIQPMRNGHILIARRTTQAILETHKNFSVVPKGIELRKVESETVAAERNLATIAFPEIEWVDLDPIHGTKENVDLSIITDAPILLRSEHEAKSFNFGLDSQGRLVIPWKSPEYEDLKLPGK